MLNRFTAYFFALTVLAAPAVLAAGKHAGGHAGGHPRALPYGKSGIVSQVTRTITVRMNDNMQYQPANIDVGQGETVRLHVINEGKIRHELILGTAKELAQHAELMRKFPHMEHSDPQSISLAGGQKGDIVWQFSKRGKVNFACLQPGHFEAGMKGLVTVQAGKVTVPAGSSAQVPVAISAAVSTQTPPAAVPAIDVGNLPWTRGVVEKIDRATGKLTIEHEDIKNLEMPAMTMVFTAQQPELLMAIAPGQAIEFKVALLHNKYMVLALRKREAH